MPEVAARTIAALLTVRDKVIAPLIAESRHHDKAAHPRTGRERRLDLPNPPPRHANPAQPPRRLDQDSRRIDNILSVASCNLQPEHVAPALTDEVQTLPDALRRSLTWDQGPKVRATGNSSTSTPPSTSSSATRTSPGSAPPTRTPIGCCASTSPRASTSPPSPKPKSHVPSPTNSTPAPASASPSRPPPTSSPSCCCNDRSNPPFGLCDSDVRRTAHESWPSPPSRGQRWLGYAASLAGSRVIICSTASLVICRVAALSRFQVLIVAIDSTSAASWALVVVASGLVPDVVRDGVRPVGEPGHGLGQRERGALGVGEVRRLSPGGDHEDALVGLARGLELAGVACRRRRCSR